MSLEKYKVARDKFEPDVRGSFGFPCLAYKHRYGRDTDEPCRTCDHNRNAVKDETEIER